MHWPYPANPAEYQAPGLGLVLGLGAIVVIFVAAVFYGAQSNAALLHKTESELDEAGPKRESNQ